MRNLADNHERQGHHAPVRDKNHKRKRSEWDPFEASKISIWWLEKHVNSWKIKMRIWLNILRTDMHDKLQRQLTNRVHLKLQITIPKVANPADVPTAEINIINFRPIRSTKSAGNIEPNIWIAPTVNRNEWRCWTWWPEIWLNSILWSDTHQCTPTWITNYGRIVWWQIGAWNCKNCRGEVHHCEYATKLVQSHQANSINQSFSCMSWFYEKKRLPLIKICETRGSSYWNHPRIHFYHHRCHWNEEVLDPCLLSALLLRNIF